MFRSFHESDACKRIVLAARVSADSLKYVQIRARYEKQLWVEIRDHYPMRATSIVVTLFTNRSEICSSARRVDYAFCDKASGRICASLRFIKWVYFVFGLEDMLDTEGSVFARVPCIASSSFKKFFEGLTDCAVVISESNGKQVAFSSFKPADFGAGFPKEAASPQDVPVVSTQYFELSEVDRSAIMDMGATPSADADWVEFRFEMADGSRDRLALALSDHDQERLSGAFVERIWPLLRRECFRDASTEGALTAADWSLLDALDVAILVLDDKALMYRQNHAAREMLADANVIRRGRGGLFAANETESRCFREAVAKAANSEDVSDDAGAVVFLTDVSSGQRVPVTLSPYLHEGRPTNYVVARVPAPPNAERVEALGRQLGLTPAESRVASLIQLGHTNREAASITGLKEQTFNTYAKRVMSKLGVRGRTELAQMLTWQCNGGISS